MQLIKKLVNKDARHGQVVVKGNPSFYLDISGKDDLHNGTEVKISTFSDPSHKTRVPGIYQWSKQISNPLSIP